MLKGSCPLVPTCQIESWPVPVLLVELSRQPALHAARRHGSSSHSSFGRCVPPSGHIRMDGPLWTVQSAGPLTGAMAMSTFLALRTSDTALLLLAFIVICAVGENVHLRAHHFGTLAKAARACQGHGIWPCCPASSEFVLKPGIGIFTYLHSIKILRVLSYAVRPLDAFNLSPPRRHPADSHIRLGQFLLAPQCLLAPPGTWLYLIWRSHFKSGSRQPT